MFFVLYQEMQKIVDELRFRFVVRRRGLLDLTVGEVLTAIDNNCRSSLVVIRDVCVRRVVFDGCVCWFLFQHELQHLLRRRGRPHRRERQPM